MSLTRSNIVSLLAERDHELNREQVDRVVTNLFDLITQAVSMDEIVKLHGFGRFEPRARAATIRPNPRTGEPVHVPAKRAIGFKASGLLKTKVNAEEGLV